MIQKTQVQWGASLPRARWLRERTYTLAPSIT